VQSSADVHTHAPESTSHVPDPSQSSSFSHGSTGVVQYIEPSSATPMHSVPDAGGQSPSFSQASAHTPTPETAMHSGSPIGMMLVQSAVSLHPPNWHAPSTHVQLFG
jgi:hypothetical protein